MAAEIIYERISADKMKPYKFYMQVIDTSSLTSDFNTQCIYLGQLLSTRERPSFDAPPVLDLNFAKGIVTYCIILDWCMDMNTHEKKYIELDECYCCNNRICTCNEIKVTYTRSGQDFITPKLDRIKTISQLEQGHSYSILKCPLTDELSKELNTNTFLWTLLKKSKFCGKFIGKNNTELIFDNTNSFPNMTKHFINTNSIKVDDDQQSILFVDFGVL